MQPCGGDTRRGKNKRAAQAMKRLVLALAAACAAGMAAPAQAACLSLGADERLSSLCVLDTFLRAGPQLRTAVGPFLERMLARQGLPQLPEDRLRTQPYVTPLLSWSDNINGGQDAINLGYGELRPEYARKSGVLAGARAGLQGRFLYRPGGYLDFNGYGAFEYAPAHDLFVTSTFARLCSYNGLDLEWTLDACLSTGEINRELTRDQTNVAEVTAGRNLSLLPGMFQRFYGGYRNVDYDGHSNGLPENYTQPQYFFGVQTLSERFPFLGIEAAFGEPVYDQTVLHQSVSATLSDQVFGRPFSVTVSHAYFAGQNVWLAEPGRGFYEAERTQRELLLSASYNVWNGYYVRLGYRDVDSNIDAFDESDFIFGISLASIRF
jgi:hypothetical protein